MEFVGSSDKLANQQKVLQLLWQGSTPWLIPMYTLEPIIYSHVDFSILSKYVDLTESDKLSLKPFDKLSKIALGIFRLNPALHCFAVTFYFELPQDTIDMVVNTGFLKLAVSYDNRVPVGFISGTLQEYLVFLQLGLTENVPRELRAIANIMYTFFNKTYNLMSTSKLKHLTDKTFCLV